MAFNNGNNQNSQANGGNNNSKEESWKAVGFLNLYLPANDGTRVKLGAIPLKAGKPREKQLADWLQENPDRVDLILAKIEMDYASAEPSDAKGFDLG